jgi:hypothetical protein
MRTTNRAAFIATPRLSHIGRLAQFLRSIPNLCKFCHVCVKRPKVQVKYISTEFPPVRNDKHALLIQEHFMILRALEQGVSEERLARALRVDVVSIRKKRHLLLGIG